jgi:hypothetical protein
LVRRLTRQPLLSLLLLGATLAAGPVLAKITGAPDTVAVVSSPLGTSNTTKNGCTPVNPCAVVTPALGSVTMSTPEMPAQPDLPASPAAAADAPAAPATPAGAAQAAANPNCPPAGARGQFVGRNGQGTRGAGQGGGQAGRGEGFRRFAQAGSRNGGAEGGGRGFGGGFGGAGRGQGGARNGAARGSNGCPRPVGAGQGRNPANAQPPAR